MSSKNPFNFEVSADIPLSNDISELPDSFSDAVQRAARKSLDCIAMGQRKCRIDFDTAVGDQTYTSLKNTLPMVKELCGILSREMSLYPILPPPSKSEDSNSTENETPDWLQAPPTPSRTMRIFFPDMGAAALARRDWKMGTNATEVPLCVETSNILNDPISSTDKMIILLCPQPSE
eukprot:gene55795-74507_t